jgi:hypothetical protein
MPLPVTAQIGAALKRTLPWRSKRPPLHQFYQSSKLDTYFFLAFFTLQLFFSERKKSQLVTRLSRFLKARCDTFGCIAPVCSASPDLSPP